MRRLPFVIAALGCVQIAHAEPDASRFEQASKLRNVGEYALAAEAYERFAREDPTNGSAPKALADAVVLRMGLGDDRKATEDAEQYLRAYASRTEDAAKIALAILLHAGEKEDWATVEREAPHEMALIERGPVPYSMQAHAVLARALATHSGDGHARASREWARVRGLAQQAPPVALSDDVEKLKQWARGADALGEALVFEADERRDATTWAPFPAFAGGDVDAWITGKVKPWIAAREASIGAIESAYKKVTEIQPVPPPRWTIIASARVAQMWTRAADEAHAPPRAASNRALKDKLEAASHDLRDRHAKGAARACVELSAKYQWTEDASRACSVWLEKTYRREYPPLDELAIAPRMRDASVVQVTPVRP